MTMTITSLETALDAALAALKTAGTVKAASVMADVPGDVEQWLRALGASAPFIVAVYNGGPLVPINVAANLYRHSPTYTVLVGVNKLRSDASARAALHPVLAAVIAALAGQQFSLAVKPIICGDISLINWTGPIMIYGFEIKTEFLWDVAAEAA